MRFLRYGDVGQEKPALLDADGQIRDLSHLLTDIDGAMLGDKALQDVRVLDAKYLPKIDGTPRLGACVHGVGKIVGVAINYHQHGVEVGSKTPDEPVLFLKATSAISGAHDDIILPRIPSKTDWEVELGVVIGHVARNVDVSHALDYVAGYCVLNDVSERYFQLECGAGNQHTKGKSADGFCPIGPYLVTRDVVGDVQNLALWTKVNGQMMQNGNTKDMIFSVAQLIAYISRFMTLNPGDVIATGTPDGVGRGRTPPIYLQAGDVIEQGIEGLGEQKHRIVEYRS